MQKRGRSTTLKSLIIANPQSPGLQKFQHNHRTTTLPSTLLPSPPLPIKLHRLTRLPSRLPIQTHIIHQLPHLLLNRLRLIFSFRCTNHQIPNLQLQLQHFILDFSILQRRTVSSFSGCSDSRIESIRLCCFGCLTRGGDDFLVGGGNGGEVCGVDLDGGC